MTPVLRCSIATLSVLASVSCVSCLPPEEAPPTPRPNAAPLVGRLQFQDRVIDLDIDAFADGPNAVPPNAYSRVMADIVRAKPKPESDERADRRNPRAR